MDFYSWSSSILATWCEALAHWKRPWCWERLKTGGEGATEDEMVGRHHQLDGLEFEKALGDDGQGSLACCISGGCRVGYDWGTEQPPHVGSSQTRGWTVSPTPAGGLLSTRPPGKFFPLTVTLVMRIVLESFVFYLATSLSMWDLSSLSRSGTQASCRRSSKS